MKKLVALPLLFLLLELACQQGKQAKLLIATAASAKFPMSKLIEEFTKEKGIECELIVSSSGKLTAQIIEGAPYHLFISADMKYPNVLFEKNLSGKPIMYAYGKLVLWTANKDLNPSVDALTTKEIKHIAVPNPKIAPYGEVAVEVLKYYNIYDQVEKKLVYGESVSQTNQFILSGTAELGFTSKSSVFFDAMKGKGNWTELPRASYSPIAQGAVMLKSANEIETSAQAFLDFLLSSEGQAILEEFGYETHLDE